MYFLTELTLQFGQLRCIQISCHFQRRSYLLIDFRVLQVLQFLASVLIVKGHRGLIFYSPFEIIDTYIATKSTCRDVIVFQQRCTCKAYTMGCWQNVHQVISKDSVLGTMSFITHHNDIVIRIDGVSFWVVELLYQREDE